MVATTWCRIASIALVCQNVALQVIALSAFCLQVGNCLAVVTMSVRSVIDFSHFSSFEHKFVALLKASLNPILIKVIRYVTLSVYIVNLVQDVE